LTLLEYPQEMQRVEELDKHHLYRLRKRHMVLYHTNMRLNQED
jgi:hypothetical protein